MLNRRRLGTCALLTTCLLALGTACSTHKSVIDVGCFGFFQGSKRTRATRDQLSADQLATLSGLRLIPPQPTCAEDTLSCSVAITSAEGTVATYATEELDSACGGTKPLIPFASFNPFLQSFPCTSAKQSMGLAPDGGATLASIAPDPRCYNGLFAAPPNPVQRLLVVDDPSIQRHLEFDSCSDTRGSPAVLHPQPAPTS